MMSLFKRDKPKLTQRPLPPTTFEECQQQNGVDNDDETQTSNDATEDFYCQLAHGSPLGLISFFPNVKELASSRLEMYQKIAECYDIPAEDILFCTVNTHKVHMDFEKSFSAQKLIIFAHIKGRPKEIEIVKTEDEFGVNIMQNGAGYGYVIIHEIREGSTASKIPHIEVGDHIEKIDGESMVGKGSVEMAKILGEIPLGTTFILRLVEPLKSRFGSIGPKTTIRYKANEQATIEDELATSSFSPWTAFPRRELTETEETLRRLELALSDVLLVLQRRQQPAQVGTLSAPLSLITFFTQLFTSFILEPSQQLYNWLWSRFTPPRSETTPSPPRQTPPPNIRRRGNIHRLPGDRGTDDDNTWNGNSTQQM